MTRTKLKSIIGVVAALVLIGVGYFFTAGPENSEPGDASKPQPAVQQDVDPESGLAWIDEADLPPQAHDTLELIDAGGSFPYDEDGTRFGNFEGVLPDEPKGFYREYTVEMPGLNHRGPLRIVTGGEGSGEVRYYWTEDHYESFDRIRR